MLTFEQIKKLSVADFSTNNKEVWESIKFLPLVQLVEIIPLWDDEEIQQSLGLIINERKQQVLGIILMNCLNKEERQLLADVVLMDRDITWEFFQQLLRDYTR